MQRRRRASIPLGERLATGAKAVSVVLLVLLVFSAVVDEEGESGEASVKVNVSETVDFVKNVDERVKDIVVSSGNWISSVGRFFWFIVQSLWHTVAKIFIFFTQLVRQPINILRKLRAILGKVLRRMWLVVRKIGRVSAKLVKRVLPFAAHIIERFEWVVHCPLAVMKVVNGLVKDMGRHCTVLWAAVRDFLAKIGRLFVDFSWARLVEVLVKPPLHVVKWVARVIWRMVPAKEFLWRLLRAVLRLPMFLLRSLWESVRAVERVVERLFLLHLQAVKYVADGFVEFMDVGRAFGRILSVLCGLMRRVGVKLWQILERFLAVPLRFLSRFKPIFVALWESIVRSAKGVKRAALRTWHVARHLPHYMVKGLKMTLRFALNIEIDWEHVKSIVKRFFNVPVQILGWGWKLLKFIGRIALKPIIFVLRLLRGIALRLKRFLWGITWEDIKRLLLSPYHFVMRVLTELTRIPWLGALFAVVQRIVYIPAILITGLLETLRVTVFTLIKTFYLVFDRPEWRQFNELRKH